MKKAIYFLIFVIGCGFLWEFRIKQMLVLRSTRSMLQRNIADVCRGEAECTDRYNQAFDECFTRDSVRAAGTPGEETARRKAISCMQKQSLRDACKGEQRCVASIDSHFDACYAVSMPMGGNPSDSNALKALLSCLNEKTGAKIF